MMSGYRKRRSSESLESDRKRISYERYDCASYIKQEYNHHVSNKGRLNDNVAAARAAPSVPHNYYNNYYTPVAPDGIRSAAVYNPQRYYNKQYVEAYEPADKRNAVYNSGYDQAVAIYDERRQMNFKHEVYINSLRQSEPRYVNFNDLRRRLSGMDIRCYHIWNFSSALDLTLDLETSLNYFVDTRNELVFLRKLQCLQCIPFSYNKITIANSKGLNNRMTFLENETDYLSRRTNELFHKLQSVVIPTVINDVRYMHSVLYKNLWTDRARHWFSQFKRVKWDHRSRSMNIRRYEYEQFQHRANRNQNMMDEIDVANRVKIKSEPKVASPPKTSLNAKRIKVEKSDHKQLFQSILNKIREITDSIESRENHQVTIRNSRSHKYEQSKHPKSQRGYSLTEEFSVEKSVNIKSEVVDTPKSFSSKSVIVEQSDTEEPFSSLLSKIQKLSASIGSCKNRLAASREEPQEISAVKVDHRAYEENESLDENDRSNSCEIIEPNVSLVTVSDDDS